ncbi:MAG: sensor histidine kinase [Ignavibacteriaceae bacterium]|nr:sensor histidine kinase [Ignavibacteriaceae bacterium]
MQDEIKEYLRLFFTFKNPVFLTIFFAAILSAFLYLFTKYIVVPLQKKHYLEKTEIELKNARLVALFAELDPDPVIRINAEGIVVKFNDAVNQLGENVVKEGKNIKEILPQIDFDISSVITQEKTIRLFHNLDGKYYSILFKGIPLLNIAQLYFNDLTARKLYEEELERSQKQLKDFSKYLQDKIEEERQRIARELHDGVGQSLSLFKIRLQQSKEITSLLSANDDYTFLLSSVDSTIKDLRNVIYDLKPKILEEMGLGPALKQLCNKITSETNIRGDIIIRGMDKRLDGKLELYLYRIAQESLSNIVKHSFADCFSIQLFSVNDKIHLMIADNGTGFNFKEKIEGISAKRSFGLINMKERVENFKGTFKVDSSPGNGTVIMIEIPTTQTNEE